MIHFARVCLAGVMGLLLAVLYLYGVSAASKGLMTPSAPTTRYVAPDGNDVHSCESPEQRCQTIQRGVDVAAAGDVIKIAGGVYTGVQARPSPISPEPALQVVYISKTLHLQGGFTVTNWNVPDTSLSPTVIDAQKAGRGVLATGKGFNSSISVTLEGLTVTGGDALNGQKGGGVFAFFSNLILNNLQITHNTAYEGGGLYTAYSSLYLENSLLQENTAQQSGGGFYIWSGNGLVKQCIIYSNTASARDGGGGAIQGSSQLSLQMNEFISNTARYGGGGLNASYSTVRVEFTQNTFINNRAEHGGGLFVGSAAVDLFRGNYFLTNTAVVAGGGAYFDVAVAIEDSEFSGNQAGFAGGGGYLLKSGKVTGSTFERNSANYGGGMMIGGDGFVMQNNRVLGNTAHSSAGGVALGGSYHRIDGNLIIGNQAYSGGGFVLGGKETRFQNNILADNDAQEGGAIKTNGAQDLVIIHTTFARNDDAQGAGVVFYQSTVALTNTIVVSQTTGIKVAGGNVRMESTLWGAGGWANGQDVDVVDGTFLSGTHNLWGDPGFVDPDDGNYHISVGSPAQDAGIEAGVHHDLDGQFRPMGWGFDLGADELPGAGLGMALQSTQLYVNKGDLLTLTLTISSTGLISTTQHFLTGTLDSWLRVLDYVAPDSTCSIDSAWGGGIGCAFNTLDVGATWSLAVRLEVSTTYSSMVVMQPQFVITSDRTTNQVALELFGQDCQAWMQGSSQARNSIQAALADGDGIADVVRVAGTCVGVNALGNLSQQVYITRPVTIQGGWDHAFLDHDPVRYPTTLTALGLGRVVYVAPGVEVTLADLQLVNGDAMGLGGCPILGDGGGVVGNFGKTSLLNSQISGGKAHCGGGFFTMSGSIQISNTLLYDNQASWGGGLFVFGSAAEVHGSSITGNIAEKDGGGIYSSQSPLVVSGTLVSDNHVLRTDGPGGGILISHANGALIQNCQLISNTAAQGAGIMASNSRVTLIGNLIQNNQARLGGGGVYLNWHPSSPGPNILRNNIIFNNRASWAGGMMIVSYKNVMLDSNQVLSNTANEVGGISVNTADLQMINTIIAGNESNTASAIGITGGRAHLTHNTLANNRGSDGGAIVLGGNSTGPLKIWITNTIIASHTLAIELRQNSFLTLTANLFGAGDWANQEIFTGTGSIYTSTGNLWGEPRFLDPANYDYHISRGSAAIDAGWPSGVVLDIDGDPRSYGLAPDIGADEILVALENLALSGASWGVVGTSYPYTGVVSPADATLPVVFTWTAGSQALQVHTVAGTIDPQTYAWAEPGIYTVNLETRNDGGALQVSQQVTICQPLEVADLAGPGMRWTGQAGVFTATLAPDDATLPYTYTWSVDEQAQVVHVTGALSEVMDYTWMEPGVKQVGLSAINPCGQVTTSLEVTVYQAPVTATLTGPVNMVAGQAYTFQVEVLPGTTSTPMTYHWTADSQAPVTHILQALNDSTSFLWAEPGAYTVAVSAQNIAGEATASQVVDVCQPPNGLAVGWSEPIRTGIQHWFMATTSPADISRPFTVTWEMGGQALVIHPDTGIEDTASFTWAEPGAHTFTVTVANRCGDTVSAGSFYVFQPPETVLLTGTLDGMVGIPQSFTATVQPADTSLPLVHTWQAFAQADSQKPGSGLVSTQAYTWEEPGTYAITVTVANPAGLASAAYLVWICQPPENLALLGRIRGAVGTPVNFEGSLSPLDTSLPLTYTWQADSQPEITRVVSALQDQQAFTWDQAGNFTVTLRVENACGQVAQSQQIAIYEPPTNVLLTGPERTEVGMIVPLTVTIQPAWVTYPATLTLVTGNTSYHQLVYTQVITQQLSWMLPGTKQISVTVSNPGGQASALHTILVYQPPITITLSGPETCWEGFTCPYSAQVAALNTSLPLTFSWSIDGTAVITRLVSSTADIAALTWPAVGTYQLTVAAENWAGRVAQTMQVIIIAPPHRLFLPVIMR